MGAKTGVSPRHFLYVVTKCTYTPLFSFFPSLHQVYIHHTPFFPHVEYILTLTKSERNGPFIFLCLSPAPSFRHIEEEEILRAHTKKLQKTPLCPKLQETSTGRRKNKKGEEKRRGNDRRRLPVFDGFSDEVPHDWHRWMKKKLTINSLLQTLPIHTFWPQRRERKDREKERDTQTHTHADQVYVHHRGHLEWWVERQEEESRPPKSQ